MALAHSIGKRPWDVPRETQKNPVFDSDPLAACVRDEGKIRHPAHFRIESEAGSVANPSPKGTPSPAAQEKESTQLAPPAWRGELPKAEGGNSSIASHQCQHAHIRHCYPARVSAAGRCPWGCHAQTEWPHAWRPARAAGIQRAHGLRGNAAHRRNRAARSPADPCAAVRPR